MKAPKRRGMTEQWTAARLGRYLVSRVGLPCDDWLAVLRAAETRKEMED